MHEACEVCCSFLQVIRGVRYQIHQNELATASFKSLEADFKVQENMLQYSRLLCDLEEQNVGVVSGVWQY